jgi:hypothetical protein
MRGLLVRVGIDSSDEGHWNAPVDTRSWSFAYVPIVESRTVRRGLARLYDELQRCLKELGQRLPDHLVRRPMHLDPDFEFLTYGDSRQRAKQIRALEPGDILVFYAGLRDFANPKTQLVYALIGVYVIRKIQPATWVSKELWKTNAHTRRRSIGKSDIVVCAEPRLSGRLARCIPIGGYRKRAYRVRKDILNAWGGLSVNDGYIQRSARLPKFKNAARFYRWFRKLNVTLLSTNNP